MTGVLFVWWYMVGSGFFRLFGNPWAIVQPIFWLIIGMMLLTIFMTDLLYGVIPLSVNMTLLTLVLFYRIGLVSFGLMTTNDFILAIVSGIALGLLFLFLKKITKWIKGVDGMGDGDIVLSPALGLLLGWPKIFVATFTAFVVGSLVGIVLIVLKKRKMSNTIPFGPFLVFGTVFALVFGNMIWTWYMGMLQ
jgi:prepilin signal peptidase PulO-like enzyme (type II secretory pathway)